MSDESKNLATDMDRILVIVHLEPGFESLDTSHLPELAKKVRSLCNLYNGVINITSEEIHGEKPYPCLASFESREWIWGFDAEYYKSREPELWVEGKNFIPTSGHPYSEILGWMHELPKDNNYHLVGGGRNECLQDIYDIFRHLDLPVKILEKYTY